MNVDVNVEYEIDLKEITFCKYELKTVNKRIPLSFPQLLQLRKNVYNLTKPEALYDIIDSENFVLLFVADKQHLIYLDIPQILNLRNTIDSFFYSFKSVSI
ncbi:hypothetical protein [Tenacibaculum jejuense]|uniref:Uncharacterized protein n=1 Tax=Tenacibaculum jejuense TaxID=584609 RepID=A0A238UGR6_9FLAO|nr:hypothetical protein [Tenacibaculum jejuense]SNR17604.1 protein of unknown function [Tenacibaculum jejuense]